MTMYGNDAKRGFGLALAIGIGCIVCAHAQAAGAGAAELGGEKTKTPASSTPYDDLDLPPLRPFTPPKPIEKKLSGGGRLFLLEDHELPVIDLVVILPGGTLLETRDKAGLAAIWAEVLRSGGSESIDGDALDLALESKGASISVSAGEDKVTIGVSALKEDFAGLLDVLAGMLKAPRFPEDKLALSRKQHLSMIARRNDDPSGIARREFARVMYGDSTPYGWTEEPDTIRSITREDLLRFHEKVLGGRALIGAVGDFEADAMATRIEKTFVWLSGDVDHIPAPVPKPQAPGVYLVDKPEINQSTIIMGHLGIQRRADDPGYFAAVVMNAVLGGGGFSSRLLQRVRTELGLAYSVYSYFSAPYHRQGVFQAVCQTKCESTIEASAAIRKEIERIRAEPVSAEELAVAKESILQQLVFASEQRSDVLERAMRYAFYGFPADYLERFQKGIAAVRAEDVQRAAKRLLHPETLRYVIVGNRAAFDADPAQFGPVHELDVERPAYEKPREHKEASAEQIARGREVIAKAIEARGGKQALSELRSLRLEGEGVLRTPRGEVPVASRVTMAFPDRVRVELMSPMFGRIVQCFDGKKGWLQGPMGVVDMPPSEAEKLREQVARDGSQLLLLLGAPEAEPALVGEAEVSGKPVWVIEAGDRTRLFIDKVSYALVRRDEEGPQGTVSTLLGDYRRVGGISIAHDVRTVAGGQERVRVKIKKASVNPPVDETLFERPGAKPSGNERGARPEAERREPAPAGK